MKSRIGNKLAVVGAKVDLGSFNRGAYLGPKAIREAGLMGVLKNLGLEIQDRGDFTSLVSEQLNLDIKTPVNIAQVRTDFHDLAENTRKIDCHGYYPLILGGDHSTSIGTIAGLSSFYENLGVIWFDAHADVNTPETSPTGSIYGMPLAINLGYGHPELISIGQSVPKVRPENVVFIGTRDLDDGEKEFLAQNQLKVYSMEMIREMGIEQAVKEALQYLSSKCDGIHLSCDLDVLDSIHVPGVRTPCENGLTLEEGLVALQLMGESKLITSAEFVEVNPLLDVDAKTAKAAINLIEKLFIS